MIDIKLQYIMYLQFIITRYTNAIILKKYQYISEHGGIIKTGESFTGVKVPVKLPHVF